jgi:6-phosphogluconolactonase
MNSRLFLFFLFISNAIGYSQNKHWNLLVGTYTKSCESGGIYTFDFDSNTGETFLKSNTDKINNPGFLSISPDKNFIYSVNQFQNESSISAFKFNSKSGKLDFINAQNSNGINPCFITNDEKNVVVANYTSGSLALFSKNGDGALGEVKHVFQQYGKSSNPKRQESPHVHMVQFSPDKKLVFATDLGKDKIYIYNYNSTSKTKILAIKDSISVKSGSGPRHFTFNKSGSLLYLLQELDGTLTVYKNNNGKLIQLQETTVVAPDFTGESSAADIHISPDGKFLYASNRGTANDISCFEIQKEGGLIFKERTRTQGKGPRNFTIDPTGNYLLVGHQYTNNIVVFKIDKDTGSLTDTGKRIEICSPVCLVFTE